MVVLVRIDDRLIHGQVVEGWLPALNVDTVVVVSREAANDETQRSLMRLALPEEVDLKVLAPEEAAAYVRGDGAERRLLVLAPGPREVLELARKGMALAKVNVGGLHYSAGRVQLGRVIYLGEEDRGAMLALLERGVALEGQAVPSDATMDLGELLRPS